MAAAQTYEPIATYTASGSITDYTFSSIPQTYTDLILVLDGTMSAPDDYGVRFNGDTGSNYSATILYANGTSTVSARTTNATSIYIDYLGLGTDQGTTIAHFMNYSNTTTYKNTLSRFGQSTRGTDMITGLWRSTAAITSIQVLRLGTRTFQTGTTFTLYGIKAA